jgi:hypothetical protein
MYKYENADTITVTMRVMVRTMMVFLRSITATASPHPETPAV